MARRFCLAALVLLLSSTLTVAAWGEPDGSDEGPNVATARAAFVEGAELAKQALWGEALSRFEESARLRPHAGTTYNIAICQRALGQYTRARASLLAALAQHRQTGDLAASTVETIEAYLEETERVLATLEIELDPPSARIAVDGRPLEVIDAATATLVAGTRPPGPGAAPPRARFRLVIDPGTHVFVIAREGFADAVVRRTVQPGSRGRLVLALERLPGRMGITASEPRAAVAVDGVDVGLAPVVLARPPGNYHVEVKKDGYEPYETDLALRPAQRLELLARLQPETPGLHERWWFWTTMIATVATVAVTTYVVTRPEPQRPPLDGGGLGWAIRVP